MPPLEFMLMQEAQAVFKMCRSTLHNNINQGLLPPQIQFGLRCSRMLKHEIEAMARAIAAGATPDQRRALVRELVALRKSQMPVIKHDGHSVAA
jgi:predicted DNA-binding transcriptional regulator AlpA